jgi:outer membrane lipoprotein-sorting protein
MKKYFLIFFIFTISLVNSESEVIQNDQEIIALIENNWNSIDTMSGRFEQIDADNNIEYGNFYFDKPYKSKFSYDHKDETIITNKILIYVLDDEGYQVDSYPIGNSPIKNILSNNIKFDDIFTITSVEQMFDKEDAYQITTMNKNSENSDGKVLFFFTVDDLTLKKWVIFDEFGNKTVLEFTNMQKNISIGPNIFVVRYRH